MNEEKFEKGQQTVIIFALGEKAVQVINDKKVSSLSKPNASIEEGKAKGNVKGCRITNKK